jgi:hypothetical protein
LIRTCNPPLSAPTLAHGQKCLAAALQTLVSFEAGQSLPRLRALFENGLDWTTRGSLPNACPMQAAAVEFDDRPGPVRDAVVDHFTRLERELGRAVKMTVEQGHFRADLDVAQFVFEMTGAIFVYYHRARLFSGEAARSRARARVSCQLRAAGPGGAARGLTSHWRMLDERDLDCRKK